jgi:soluble lytic murein transglycosylase-like protein
MRRDCWGICLALTMGGALLPACAYADLWGYVDEAGVVHTAREKLDDRYQLFVKGEPTDARAAELRLSSELKVIPATDNLSDHVIFRRVSKSPNVAKFDSLVIAAAEKSRLDPALVKAVIAVESAYDPGAVSPKGATGLMQLIPGTAQRYGVKVIADPKENIGGGTRYLRDLLDLFQGNLQLALAGYNAGEGAVQRYKNTIPPYPETQNYVKLVMQFYGYFNPDGAARYGIGGTKNVRKDKDGRYIVTLPGRRMSAQDIQKFNERAASLPPAEKP